MRTVEDCALVMQIIAGADASDPDCSTEPVPNYVDALREPVRGMRVGIPRGWLDENIDPQIGQALRAAANAMASAGMVIVEGAKLQCAAVGKACERG